MEANLLITFEPTHAGRAKEEVESLLKDAKEKAKVLASELGVGLGKVVSFSENSGGYPMYVEKRMMDSALVSSVAPAPVLPKGENKITSNVSITYEIR